MLILNVKKVESEKERLGLTWTAIASLAGLDRQRLFYHKKNMTVRGAEIFADVFDLEAKDLLMEKKGTWND